ncbi:Urease accessory protein UreF [Hyphomicrobium sp. ghe19]|nr:Urease accessory protein UreF [Hyphomicrobium sp. ghe19]
MTAMTILTNSRTSTVTDLTDSYRRLPEVLHLLQFGDSALPIGGFSFSNGLESAIQQEIVSDAPSLREFVLTVMHQSATSDGVALLCAHRAAKAKDIDALMIVDRAAFERKLNEETRLMTVRMGRKLAELADAIMSDRLNHEWLVRIKQAQTAGTHPVSLALVLAALGVEARDAFGAQQYGIATTILGAALRLMRLSFVDTQKILLEATRMVAPAYEKVRDAELNDMASFLPMVDILAAVHVKGHVRMFMN